MINLDVDKLKEGDVFDTFDGNNHRDLEFVKADKETVYAKKDGKAIEFRRVEVEENGSLSPREETIDCAVGYYRLENRRKETLKFVKTLHKNVPKDALFNNRRTDKTTLLPCVEPFSELSLNGSDIEALEKGEELPFFIYIVEDREFTEKENERVKKLCQLDNEKRIIDNVNAKQKELVELFEELERTFKPQIEELTANKDVKGLTELYDKIPLCYLSETIQARIHRVKTKK